MKNLWEAYTNTSDRIRAMASRVVHFVMVAGFFVGLIFLAAIAILIWFRWVEVYGL